MKAHVRPAQKEDLERIAQFLHANHDPRLSLQQWQRLFEYPHVSKQANLGFLLEAQNQLVGFLGAIYSDRLVGGHLERFCSLTSWHVVPEFRASSIRLLMELIGQDGYTFVNLAPSEQVGQLMLRCGFQPLEYHKLLCGPTSYRVLVGMKRRPELRHRLFEPLRLLEKVAESVYLASLDLVNNTSPRRADSQASLTIGPDSIRPMLSPPDQRLLDDHRHCGHFLLSDADVYSYIVTINRKIYFGRTSWNDYVVSDLLHVSDRQLALRNWDMLWRAIVQDQCSRAVTVDERLFASRPEKGLRIPCHSYFKSPSGLTPSQVDALYTEVPFLDVLIYA